MDKGSRDFWGYTCIVLGGLFCICAIVIFIFANRYNFISRSVEATIMDKSEMVTGDGQRKTMLTLAYRVGDQLLTTGFEYDGKELAEDEVQIEVSYLINSPRTVLITQWNFESLFVLLMGGLIVFAGLCIKGFILDNLKLFEEKPAEGATATQKEIFYARKKVLEGLFPFSAGFISVIFGVVMIILGFSWVMWLFVGAGVLLMLYIGLEMFPAAVQWKKLSSLTKVKAKVIDTEVDFYKEGKKEDKENKK